MTERNKKFMRKEIEVKAKVHDAGALLITLTKAGCVFSDPIRQEDRVFVHGDDPFPIKLGMSALRIRKNSLTSPGAHRGGSLVAGNDEILFTFKRPLSNGLDKLEHEVAVGDAGELEEILKEIGFHEASLIKKVRRKTNYKGYEICIDVVDELGSFIEVEKIADDVDSAKVQDEMFLLLRSFGVKPEDRIMVGYDVLMYEYERLAKG
jgi:adenylate cyclase class 2